MNIKKKFYLSYVIVVVIPILIVGYIIFSRIKEVIAQNEILKLEIAADLKENSIVNYFEDFKIDALVTENYWNIKTNFPILIKLQDDHADPAYTNAVNILDSQLQSFMKTKELLDIMLLSPEGKILYCTNERHKEIEIGKYPPGYSIEDLAQWKKGVWFSKPFQYDKNNEVMLVSSVDSSENKFLGYIAFEIDMKHVYKLINDRTGLGITGETIIAVKDGNQIRYLSSLRHWENSEFRLGANTESKSAPLPMVNALNGINGSSVAPDYRGVSVIAVSRHIPLLNWGLVAKVDTSEAFLNIDKLRNFTLYTMGLAILISFVLIVWLVSKRMISPIIKLAEVSKKMESGDLTIRADEKTVTGELLTLYNSFNSFAQTQQDSIANFEDELSKRTKELEISSRYDNAFGKISSIFASTFDIKFAINNMLAILSEYLSFPCSAYYSYDEWAGALVSLGAYGVSDTHKDRFELSEGLVGQAATDKKAVIVEDLDTFSMKIETGIFSFKPHSVIIQPVFYQDKLMGTLVISSTKPLTDLDKSFTAKLAQNIGIASQNLSQHENLQELTKQMKIRGDEISKKNLELENANRLKTEFLANMSHELRTPLNAIIGFSEVLKDGVMGNLTTQQKEYSEDIFNSGKHLLSLINDILDLSKIDAGKMTLDVESIDLEGLLNNSLSIVKEKAYAHNINLIISLDKEIGTISADARKFKQIVYNLLSNAVKFTADKGSVTLSANRLKASDSGSPDILNITVTDNGIGMSEEGIAKLFKPFEQLDGSLSRKYEGTGLGLAMVKKLVELHNGSVEVSSELGKGSCFTVEIPYPKEVDVKSGISAGSNAAEQKITEIKAIDSLKLPAGKIQTTALIVEDNEDAANILRLHLESANFSVHVAPTAEKGLEMAQSLKPDLITLDIMLPGMDGWKFLEKIKNSRELSSIPVVIVSIVADKNKGFSLGASKVLQKPVSKAELMEAIAQIGFILKNDDKSSKVLVVDDDPMAVEFISKYFESEGFSVQRAYGGREGIDTVLREMPDLLVLDLMMPEVTGFDVVNAIRARTELAKMKIIILTAKIITPEDKKLLNGNVSDIVMKGGFNGNDFIIEAKRALLVNSEQLPVISEESPVNSNQLPVISWTQRTFSQRCCIFDSYSFF